MTLKEIKDGLRASALNNEAPAAEVVKNAKYRVKNAEGGYDVIHLETSAQQVLTNEERQFVTEGEKEQFKANTLYTNEMPTVNDLGGIKAGTSFDNMPVNEVLTKLLYPYVAPVVGANCTPNGGTYECGNTQKVTRITANVTKKSEKITKVEFCDGSTVLETKEGAEVANGGSISIVTDIDVNTNKNFTVKVTDAENKTYSANTGSFTFVYPYYMGVCAEEADINEDLVKGLTKKIESKGNKSHSFTCDYQRMVFAYPKSHGALRSIIDPNNFDITGTFGRQEVSITGLDGKAVPYYVYVNSASTVSNFTVKFNY